MSTSVGRDSKGRFVTGSEVAKMAGRKGGKAAQKAGKAHPLTSEERAKGGENSHAIPSMM